MACLGKTACFEIKPLVNSKLAFKKKTACFEIKPLVNSKLAFKKKF